MTPNFKLIDINMTKMMMTMKKLALALALCLLPTSAALAQLLSQTNSPPTNDSSLISPETRINYNFLRQLLATGQWRKANDRTKQLMLKAANREAQGWLSSQNIEKFPCWDLKTIDSLWKEYSKGRFGFSIQFPIFVETGNRPGRLVDVDAYEKFGDRVGWRKEQRWIDFKENLNYSLDAPIGHLPNPRQEYQINGGRLEYVTLSKRMVDCKLVTPPANPTPPASETNPLNVMPPANETKSLNQKKK